MLRSPWDAGENEAGIREARSLRRSRDIRVEGQSAKHAPNDEDDEDDGAQSAITPGVPRRRQMQTDGTCSRPSAAHQQVPDRGNHDAVQKLRQSPDDISESACKSGAAHGASPHDYRRTASRPSDTNTPETERSGVATARPWTDRSASGSGSALQGMRCGEQQAGSKVRAIKRIRAAW